MSRNWQISIVGAVVCHLAVLFGFQITLSHPARLSQESAVEVSLVAAPAAVVPTMTPAPPAEPMPIPRATPPPEVVKAPEPVIEPIKPTEAVIEIAEPTNPPVAVTVSNAVAVVASVPAPAPAIGDGSSKQQGLDTTSQKAQVGVRAQPNYLQNPEPPYPLAARRRRESGVVLLIVVVTAQGRAAKVDLKQSSGYPVLDDAALRAVRDWEFQPARVGSQAIDSEIEVPVRFKLTN